MGRNGSSKSQPFQPVIKIVGLGGGGCNVVARMGEDAPAGVEMIAANTDSQALQGSGVSQQVLLGPKTTGGRGAGSKPEVGRACAEESSAALNKLLRGAHMVFIAAGLGGGTGSGSAPVVARLVRAQGGLAVAVVTLPFTFEGKRRGRVAADSLTELTRHADIVLVIPNDKLVDLSPRNMTLLKAFSMADDVLRDVIRGIADLVTGVGLVNVDFADLRTVMESKGKGVIGLGAGRGEERALEAAQNALANPLMGTANIGGAKGLLVHITGDESLGILEVNQAMGEFQRMAGPDSNVIFGATTHADAGDAVSILVIATGIDEPF